MGKVVWRTVALGEATREEAARLVKTLAKRAKTQKGGRRKRQVRVRDLAQ